MLQELVPKIRDSAVTVSLCPADGQPDVKYAVELGMCIMLDKPILVLAQPDMVIPERLRRVADRVIVGDMDNPVDKERVAAEIQQFMLDFGPADRNNEDDE